MQPVTTSKYGWRPLGESNPCCRDENPVSWATRRWGRIGAAVLHYTVAIGVVGKPGTPSNALLNAKRIVIEQLS